MPRISQHVRFGPIAASTAIANTTPAPIRGSLERRWAGTVARYTACPKPPECFMTLSAKALVAAELIQELIAIGADWEGAGPEEAMRIRTGLARAISDLQEVHAKLWPWPQYPQSSN